MTVRQKLADFLRRELFSLGSLPRSSAVTTLSTKAQILGVRKEEAAALAVAVVDALVLTEDIGSWTSFGEPVLLQRERRKIALDTGAALILGGDPNEGEAYGLLRKVVIESAFECEAANSVDAVTEEDRLSIIQLLDQGKFVSSEGMSLALRKLLFRLGVEPDGDLSDWALEVMRDVSEKFSIALSGSSLDHSQQKVASERPSARLVVTAGPGSGKTHTASARVIELVKAGVRPANIFLITFTRVAAYEISERVAAALADLVYGSAVQCFTLDSFAWHLIDALSENSEALGYDHSIRRARRILNVRDQRMVEWIGRIEHLIIDEAQDIVGIRQEFCNGLVEALPASSGATVFGDAAQAIYGAWADQEARDVSSKENLHSLLSASPDWQKLELGLNHRTTSSKLKAMVLQARGILGDDKLEPEERYMAVRESIEKAASTQSVDLLDPRFPWKIDNLILARSRVSAEAASARLSRHGRPHRLKLSGQTAVLEPLVGALCIGKTSGEAMTRMDVERRFNELSPNPFNWTSEEAFSLLKDVSGSGKANPKLADIVSAVERSPFRISKDFIGQSGPQISSIHGAKGREAEEVLLLLPPLPSHPDVDWDEEARVLFVAASRASKRLHLGRTRFNSGRTRSDGSRWLSGVDGGLALSGCEGLSPIPGREPVEAIWGAAFDQPTCTFRKESSEAEWKLVLRNGFPIAFAQPSLAQNLDFLADGKLSLPYGSLRVAGATTVAISRKDGKSIGVTLLPLLQGTIKSSAIMSDRGAA